MSTLVREAAKPALVSLVSRLQHAPTVCKGTWRTSVVWHRTGWTELTYRAMKSDRFLKSNSETPLKSNNETTQKFVCTEDLDGDTQHIEGLGLCFDDCHSFGLHGTSSWTAPSAATALHLIGNDLVLDLVAL